MTQARSLQSKASSFRGGSQRINRNASLGNKVNVKKMFISASQLTLAMVWILDSNKGRLETAYVRNDGSIQAFILWRRSVEDRRVRPSCIDSSLGGSEKTELATARGTGE